MSAAQIAALKVVAAVALVVAAVVAWNWYIGSVVRKADAAGYSRAQGEFATRENEQLKKAIAERDRLATKLDEVSRDAAQKTASLAGAQRAAADAGVRLRNAIAALARVSCAAPAAAAAGAPADAAAGVLADVQRRLDEAQERVARFADESHISGLACERSYDAGAVNATR